VAEVSYIGNHGLHIWRRGVNFNDIPANRRAAVAQAFITNNPNLQTIVSNSRRFPNLGPITMSESTGDSNYKALQVWVNRRFTDRLSYQVSYTWSHAVSNVPLTSFTSATTATRSSGKTSFDAVKPETSPVCDRRRRPATKPTLTPRP